MATRKQQKGTAVRCEGWRRYGGAFTLGPVRWEQCEEEATVMLVYKDDGKRREIPSCAHCWKEAIENKIPIIEARPI